MSDFPETVLLGSWLHYRPYLTCRYSTQVVFIKIVTPLYPWGTDCPALGYLPVAMVLNSVLLVIRPVVPLW